MKTRVLVSKIKHDEGKMIVFTENREFQKLPFPEGSSPSPGEMIEIDLPDEGAENKQAYNKKPFFKIYHSNKKWITNQYDQMVMCDTAQKSGSGAAVGSGSAVGSSGGMVGASSAGGGGGASGGGASVGGLPPQDARVKANIKIIVKANFFFIFISFER